MAATTPPFWSYAEKVGEWADRNRAKGLPDEALGFRYQYGAASVLEDEILEDKMETQNFRMHETLTSRGFDLTKGDTEEMCLSYADKPGGYWIQVLRGKQKAHIREYRNWEKEHKVPLRDFLHAAAVSNSK